jgi:AcrR family transcriptional regulator
MSGKSPSGKPAERPVAKLRKPDKRALRSRKLLGDAFIMLIREKAIEEVTVQDVLQRSGVGRSTFYLHFRDKNDLLLCQLDMFLEMMSSLLDRRGEVSKRVAPVAEMFDHIGSQQKLVRTLKDGGRLNDFYDLAQDHFTRGIENRLKESGRFEKLSRVTLTARSSALAGSLLSLLRWWLERGAKDPSPEEMDKLFHTMVWKGVAWNLD